MVRTSILEKLEVIKDLIFGEPMLMIVFIGFIIIGIVLFAFSFNDKRKYIKFYFIGYIFILIALIVEYNVDLYKILDYLINNIFYILIFPNAAVYGFMILVSNILLLIGIFKENTPKVFKIVNVIFYSLLGYLLFLILNVVVKNDIDVYSNAAVYTDGDLCPLIQFSMIIFLIWIAILIIYKIITKFKSKKIIDDIDIPVNEVVEPITDVVEPTIELKQEDDTMSLNTLLNTSSAEETNGVNEIYGNNVNTILPVKEEKVENINISNNSTNDNSNVTFTKEEYKLLLEILQREKENRKYL